MLFGSFQQDRPYLERKFRESVCDPASGEDNETLKRNILNLAERLEGAPHEVIKAEAFAYACGHVQIDVNPQDWFVTFGCWNRRDRPLNPLIGKWHNEVFSGRFKNNRIFEEQNRSGASRMWADFDHSVPDWDAVFALGFAGLRDRARSYRVARQAAGELNDAACAYFDGIEITYTAILSMLERFHRYALKRAFCSKRVSVVAECLESLICGGPRNLYEALQLIYLYFVFGEHIDRFQVRSLGNLDRILGPFYLRDLAKGRYTEKQVRELLAYFLMQWASIDNYWGHPFYLGGTEADGESGINELSYLILDVYDQLDIPTPKIQLKISSNTPTAFIDKALDMIRRGHNSIVFLGEPGIRRALLGLGCTDEEVRDCAISGCYEVIPRGRGNATCAGHINMLKPIELVFHNGVDPGTGIRCGISTGELDDIETFEAFYAACLRQLEAIIETIVVCADEFESYLHEISPAQVYSATIENSLRTAKDAFQDGSIYNLSSILIAGFATAVDALMIVKEFVFEKREVTLTEFRDILQANWSGHEKLRLKALHHRHKFGNGIGAVDALAENLARFIAGKINFRPNGRNGFYTASLHSARLFIELGERTGATPDGRLGGEEMSKNISPTMGMDVNGVTALIKSVTRIDSAWFPGDFPLDVMMHPATVRGSEGLAAMRELLNVYFRKNGISIHFNIMDANVLLDAQKHPGQYEGLQVRVCGWNVRFNDIAKKEQDEYIKRAMNIME